MFPFGGSSAGATRPPPRRPARIPSEGVLCFRSPSPVVAWDARRQLSRPDGGSAPAGFRGTMAHDGEGGSSGAPRLQPVWDAPQCVAHTGDMSVPPGFGRTTAHDGEARSSRCNAPVRAAAPFPLFRAPMPEPAWVALQGLAHAGGILAPPGFARSTANDGEAGHAKPCMRLSSRTAPK